MATSEPPVSAFTELDVTTRATSPLMVTMQLPHLPQHALRIGLFKNVKNAAFLRQQLLQGNMDFEYAFLDASVILSRFHVLAACFRAINDTINNRLRSRNVHSEIVFALSPNNNIAESFRRFGLSDDTKNILAIKVGGDADAIDCHLSENVEGELTTFNDETLAEMSDPYRLKKVYKIEVTTAGKAEAEAFLLGTMALKGS